MALYDFKCENCKVVETKKLSFAEHDILKESLTCATCCGKMIQVVAPLRFKLNGYGWYNSELTQGIDPYGISDTEIRNNLDEEKRKENWCFEQQEIDKKEGL